MKKHIILFCIAFVLFTMAGCINKGCMVPCATNFDEDAKKDDGECQYSQPAGTTTSILKNTGYLIDFATGAIDSIDLCTPGYEYDLQVMSEMGRSSSGYDKLHLYFDMQFPHRAKGDSCKGEVIDKWGNVIDNGGTFAAINGEADDQNWNTCTHSPKYFEGRTGALSAQTYKVVSTREGKKYKLYIDNILTNGGNPSGVKITWIVMQE